MESFKRNFGRTIRISMKKFVFKLERILKYRQLIKDEKKKELILKNQILKKEEDRLNTLSRLMEENKIGEGYININFLLLSGQYSVYLAEEIKNQKEVIKKSINDVEVAKNEYLLASKDSRALELLREKQETEYEKNLLKEEEKESDDTVIQRFCEENELLI